MTESIGAGRLRELIRQTNTRLDLLLAGLNVDQMNRPGAVGTWSVKDAIAHIAFWERYAAGLLRAVVCGATPQLDVEDATETRNASVVAQYYQQPLGAVIAEWYAAREELLDQLQLVSDDDLNDPKRFPWSDGRTLLDRIAANSYRHEQEHIEQIREWMKQL
jgi:hypothetical protein